MRFRNQCFKMECHRIVVLKDTCQKQGYVVK